VPIWLINSGRNLQTKFNLIYWQNFVLFKNKILSNFRTKFNLVNKSSQKFGRSLFISIKYNNW
jgi:hypothetical protein